MFYREYHHYTTNHFLCTCVYTSGKPEFPLLKVCYWIYKPFPLPLFTMASLIMSLPWFILPTLIHKTTFYIFLYPLTQSFFYEKLGPKKKVKFLFTIYCEPFSLTLCLCLNLMPFTQLPNIWLIFVNSYFWVTR